MTRAGSIAIAAAMLAATSLSAQEQPAPSPPPVQPAPPVMAAPMPMLPPNVRNEEGLRLFDLDAARRDPRRERRAYSDAVSFTRCVTRFNARGAGGLLKTSPGSLPERRQLQELTSRYGACAISRAYVPVILLRGAFAEALLRRSPPMANTMRSARVEIERYRRFERIAAGSERDNGPAMRKIAETARCQVVIAPWQVWTSLATPIDSARARGVIDQVYKAAPACAGQAAPDRISLPLQRAFLAEALYHWAEVNRAPTHVADYAGSGSRDG